jgi:hypothetical protein
MFFLLTPALALASSLPSAGLAGQTAAPSCTGRKDPCLAIGKSGTLSLDAAFRSRTQSFRPTRLGINGSNDSLVLYRALASADLRLQNGLVSYLQLGAHAETGRRGGPGGVDQDALDLHQAWFGWKRDAWSMRFGRQEAPFGSSRIVSLRDGPNIRLAFDGARITVASAAHRLDLIAFRPVRNKPGAFDDGGDQTQALWGAYATLVPAATSPTKLDVYWLGYQRRDARFAIGTGDEYRQSFGARLFGWSVGWDWNWEAIWQQGRFDAGAAGRQDIRAWTLATDSGFSFAAAAWKPRIGLKADIASGDANPNDHRLQTFNGLFPKASYFSEASLLAPANLIDLQPTLTLHPREGFEITAGWDLVWKQRKADAVYTTPTPQLAVPGSAGTSRRVGNQIKLETRMQINSKLEARLDLVHFNAGPAVREAGGSNVDYVATTLAWQW